MTPNTKPGQGTFAGGHDPFTWFRPGQIVAPSVVALGQVGAVRSRMPRTVNVLPPIVLLNEGDVT